MRVMTWNLWWHFGDHERRWPRIVETIRDTDPDVICLQEVWSDDGGADDAVRLADELGHHLVRTDHVFWNGQSFGNAVLSRWPVERITDVALPNEHGEPGHRRIVIGGVATPWGRWPVGATHLDFPADASAVRSAQLRRIMELSIELRSGDPLDELPLVLGGDLNAMPESDEVRMLTGLSPGVRGIAFSDAWQHAGDGDGRTWVRENPASSDSAWPDRRLDYVLVSWPRPKPVGNPIRAWTTGRPGDDGVWPSDHLAVVVDLVTPTI